MDILYIVIPAYNESETIESVINDWYPVVEKHNGGGLSRLVIIDDGSKDNTYAIMQEYAKDRPLFEPVTKPNGGHGATVLFGYNYALERGADYIFQTDSDGQTLPSEFEPFWDERENWDMVIGWRNNRQDGSSRIFVTKTLKAVIRLKFGVTVTDANTPFRLMQADKLQAIMDVIPHDYFLCNVAISAISKKWHYRMGWYPITFRPRQGGVNSINMKRIMKIGWKALGDFVTINRNLKNTRP